MSTVRSLCHPLNREKLVHVHFKDPLSLGRRPTTAILIRGRSVVQVHPGPPFKSPVNTRRFSLFPFPGIFLTKLICQPFVNFSNSQAPNPPVTRNHVLWLVCFSQPE